MEKDEDSLVIFAVLIIIGFVVCKACFVVADYMDKQESHRKEFYTALANDLARMDKLIEEQNKRQPKQTKLVLINRNFAGRN
jgi:sensor histidine kinase regulating citrate/malate metabolism